MTLDVLVPTYQRPQTLTHTIDSLMAAPVPDGLDVAVTVIQNDDSAETSAVLNVATRRYHGRLTWLREPVSGKSHALNTGIRATHRELVGIVDDDEQVAPGWFGAVSQSFADPRVDFIGGPCLPRWGVPPPGWLPPAWRGVIGHVDNGPDELVFEPHGTAILMGGNAVIRRRMLERVGGYSEHLGPSAERRLFSCEDQDVYDRLMALGAHGRYVPQLRIYHYVPERRLTKGYHRRWSFWNGVSRSVLESLRPSPVRRIGRVPRYLFGTAARHLVRGVRAARSDSAAALEAQLSLLHLIGFVYGSYRYRNDRGR